jgi:hypothetical protein
VLVSSIIVRKFFRRCTSWIPIVLAAVVLLPGAARAQVWTWKTEDVDKSADATAIAVDADGNVHLTYGNDQGEWKYAFRQAGTTRWDTTVLAPVAVNYVNLALDAAGNPHVCSTLHRLKYAEYNGKTWSIQDVAPDASDIQYSCSVGVSPDGTPHLAWYKVENPDRTSYVHLKYASLVNGMWLARTVDFDMQTGKWHSMAVDSKGVPHLSYDAYVDGRMKYAVWLNDAWNVRVVQARVPGDPEYAVGMGNHLVLDAEGKAHISYYTSNLLRYASEKPDGWDLQTVDSIHTSGGWVSYRSYVVLDKAGNPHIVYQDGTAVKHAYRDGKQWHIQLVVPSGPDGKRYVSMAIDKNDVMYVSYRDPDDGSLKVAIGTPRAAPPQTASAAKTPSP